MSDKTNARNLEARFEAGEDVLDYFDLDNATQPLLEKERVNLDIPHWMVLRIDRTARRKGITRQAQIKQWLAERLQAERQPA